MKVSDYIVQFFEKENINTVFSLSWWMITHLEDSIFLNKKINLFSMKHEQAWAFAAEWYARSTWKIWIAMWTSWPWATNMITWIANSFFDSIPVIYICWQVNTNEISQDNNIRQTGFQEADIVSMTKKITKFSYQILKTEEIKYILEKSLFLSSYWRKWPILLDIPMDIQKQEINTKNLVSFFDSKEYNNLIKSNHVKINENISKVINSLKKSSKPIILIWWWTKYLKNKDLILKLIQKYNLPIVSSLMWLDTIDHWIENFIWMIWSYGNREANIAISNSDLILVLGSRLDIRQTWSDKEKFTENKTIIHVDIDKNELGYNISKTQIKINLDLDIFLKNLLSEIENNNITLNYKLWLKKIIKIKKIISKTILKKEWNFYNSYYILNYFSKLLKKDTIVINDVWQNQMISSTSFILKNNDQILNSWWLWSMWYSIPASIWSAIWNQNSLIISINWDWGFQMNIQELETIKYHNLPILIIILNNNSLWMVREFQDNYFWWRNIWTVIGYSCPNIHKISKAFWIDYLKIWKWNFKKILTKASEINRPTILEIEMYEKSSITKVMFWDTIDNQSPILDTKLKEIIKTILNN